MVTMLTAPGLTLLFLGVVIGLGIAVVWMLWEVERVSKPRRNSDRLIASQHLLDPGGAGQHRHR